MTEDTTTTQVEDGGAIEQAQEAPKQIDFTNPEQVKALLDSKKEAISKAEESPSDEQAEDEGRQDPSPVENKEKEPDEEQEEESEAFLFKRTKDGRFAPAGKFVPRGELNRTKQEADQIKERAIRAEAELNQIKALIAAQAHNQNRVSGENRQVPEFDPLDPEAWEKTQGVVGEVKGEVNTLRSEFQAMIASIAVRQQRQEFESQNPDYVNAVEFLAKQKTSEAKLMGFSDDEAAGYAYKHIEKIGGIGYLNGKNTAQAVYEAAKLAGYSPKSSQRAMGPDLARIAENKQKSDSIRDVRGINMPISGAPKVTTESFKKNFVIVQDGRVVGIDHTKLAEHRAKLNAM